MEKIKIVPLQEKNDKGFAAEETTINPEDLDTICTLNVNETDKNFFQNINDGNKIYAILHSLSARNIKDELPISEPTFRYKRNLEESEKIKISVYKLITKKQIDKNEDTGLLEDAATLLELERRKAHWLEKNYYPSLYQRAVNSAKGEVNQFLIKQKNTALLERFTENKDVNINLKDELTYLVDGNDPDSAGVYSGGEIDIRVPSYYTGQDEWKIFLVSVH